AFTKRSADWGWRCVDQPEPDRERRPRRAGALDVENGRRSTKFDQRERTRGLDSSTVNNVNCTALDEESGRALGRVTSGCGASGCSPRTASPEVFCFGNGRPCRERKAKSPLPAFRWSRSLAPSKRTLPAA